MMNPPDWWSWELELSFHVLDRMIDRRFSETDLRTMLADASDIAPNKETGRWTVTSRHQGVLWEVIVEPLALKRILRVVTAYEVD
jgi:hypothetical protein